MRDLARIQNLTYLPFFAVSEVSLAEEFSSSGCPTPILTHLGQTVELPSAFSRALLALQMFSDYHKYIFACLTGGGLAMLGVKFLRGRKK